jgi:lipoprotein-anchoring transpeptidase ErfK/SrfK
VSAAIQLRAYGTHVQCLEAALVNGGYTLAGPNLYYDWSTYLAVQAFQRSRGQVADGIAGPITLHALGIWNGPPPSLQGLPANSGTGRRIVYHRGQQRVWAIDASGNVIKTHRVSGRLYEPYRGTYSVYSRSLYTYSTGDPNVKWRYMVRFAYGPNGGRIGFHEIPNKFGVPLQSVAQLGQPLSGGCVRQSTPDAQWMWNWAGVGTKVVVI